MIFYKQLNAMDCGPACLRMVARFYGKTFNAQGIRRSAGFDKDGVSLLGLSEAAENIGFRTRGVKISFQQLIGEVQGPCILHWANNHFVVFIKYKRNFFGQENIVVADPAKGIINYNKSELLQQWITDADQIGKPTGIALLLDPTSDFYNRNDEYQKKKSWKFVLVYLLNSKVQLSMVLVSLIITSLFQLIFPFLTQSIVDTGIGGQNLQYVTIVLLAQSMLILSRTTVDFVRSRILLNLSAIINLSILSDFWIKLTRLPISYFDSYHTGDTLQRLGDSRRIESFLTGSTLTTFFSLLNFIVFGAVLIFYNVQLFIVFLAGSALYFTWIRVFLKIKRKINYQNFKQSAKGNNATLQLVQGMQEIKLHGAEQLKRWEWEEVQAGVYKLSFRNLFYTQIQQSGAVLINESKNIVITFLVAQMVVNGTLTLGAMLAVQYIIGQLNSPIDQFVGFVQSAQDAKIGLERLSEIHQLDDEESDKDERLTYLPERKTISIADLSFSYPGSDKTNVIEKISMTAEEGQTTAIVGASGSGKTTLLKLLLRFYSEYTGDIKIGEVNLKYISASFWRKNCGVVLQEGFIFNDSIAGNIAVGFEQADLHKLVDAAKTANILEFIESLPNGFNTKLGTDGVGISQGQKQRILIARAVYKNPTYLFFDEATNSLDANNEKSIVENLQTFFHGRTVIVVAHRLSTVKNADKIIVLDKGKIIEQGTHSYLISLKGRYYELVHNQLELGN